MAKETTIIIVYDTKKLQREEDDPNTAILYFHPNWVSDHQKTSLCGQLMGSVHCLKRVLNCPKIIALDSGKFSITVYGKYFLVVGTDRNINDWVLEYRADMLNSLVHFYHRDIEKMADIYGDSSALSAKLYHMFETYLKIINFGGNIFSYIPTISFPKSGSNVFIEAINILQYCQGIEYVLGGLVLFHNKVVATQLSANVTKHFVLTDPYRIKSPAEVVETDFHLPLGVQLLQVYISTHEYNNLSLNCAKAKFVFNDSGKKMTKVIKKPLPSKEPTISNLKRDCSLLFTSVPEEDFESGHSQNVIVKIKPISRPKFLNLKNKTSDTYTDTTSKAIYTPLAHQTNVLSTPITELKKVLHVNTITLCESTIDENHHEPDVIKKCNGIKNGKELIKASYVHRSHSSSNLCSNHLDKNFKKRRHKSIGDPMFMVSESNGKTISYCYDELKKYYNSINEQNKLEFHSGISTDNLFIKDFQKQEPKAEPNQIITTKTEKTVRRKSLSLPLKSLSFDSSDQKTSVLSSITSGLLTPLMHKLSIVPLEERSSTFCSYTTTPLESKDITSTILQKRLFEKTDTICKSSTNEVVDEIPKRCVLFICGQQDTVVGMLLEDKANISVDVITKLWEICTDHLGTLEKQLHQCMEPYSGNTLNEREQYSFLHLDNQWDTIKRGGPWSNLGNTALTHLHRDFQEAVNLTEIIWRDNDSIIYGYRSGDTEVFYYQPESINSGLPAPSDPMGTIPVKAKRVLERDHAIVLL